MVMTQNYISLKTAQESATSHQQKAHGRSKQKKGRKWKRMEKRQEKKKYTYIYIHTFYLAHFISFTLAT